MQSKMPSLDEWRQLYQAATEFRNLAPWQWMADEDIFGVQNPETGEIGYCSVMGALGEHFALGVYLGSEGLESVQYIMDYAEEQGDFDFLYVQKCLMASFENREDLLPDELKRIESLGYKYRGAYQWPQFARYDPGYFPWALDAADARFLTFALQQAAVVAQKALDNPDLLNEGETDAYFVRQPLNRGKRIVWQDTWTRPAPLVDEEIPEVRLNPSQLAKLKNLRAEQTGTMEIDYFYMPTPIQDPPDSRPFFPNIILFVDTVSGIIVHTEVVPHAPAAEELIGIFTAFLEQQPIWPQTIYVEKLRIHKILHPVVQQLGIQLKIANHLHILPEARKSLFDFWKNMEH